MINSKIPKPELSSRFDVEDIRALRIWNSIRWKDADFEEIRNDIAEHAKPISDKIGYVFELDRNCYMHYPKK
jgi:hypothetical protein